MILWIVIHSLIFVLFLIGFLLSMGVKLPEKSQKQKSTQIFYKLGKKLYKVVKKYQKAGQNQVLQNTRLLHPTENTEELAEAFYIEKMGNALGIIFIGNILGLMLAVMAMSDSVIVDGNLISRNTYGEGNREIELEVTYGEEKLSEPISVTVQERQYTSEEINSIFDTITARLETEILGENETASVVCYDLNLVTGLPEYPVEISWKLDDYDVMNSTGKLQTENLKPEGTPVQLTAVLNYFEFQGEHSFYVMVYPPPKTQTQEIYDRIKSMLESYQKETIHYEDMILPDLLDGNQLKFKTPADSSNISLFLLFLAAAFFIYMGQDKDLEKEVKKREQEMMMDYPEIVSKMTLLLGAGMTIKGAFEKIALEYEKRREKYGHHYAYEEMLIGIREMQGGVAEGDVYIRFGERCHIQRFIKLGALLSQNLRKGTTGILQMMESEERDAFEDRKSLARKLGEEAGTKLLLPMGLMLVVVMIIVILPAFVSFSI